MAFPKRQCPICGKGFSPRLKAQRACGPICSRTLAGRTLAKRYPFGSAKAVAALKLASQRRVEAVCHKRWPELSVREIEIFNFAMRHGFNRGYSKGYYALKRAYVKQKAVA